MISLGYKPHILGLNTKRGRGNVSRTHWISYITHSGSQVIPPINVSLFPLDIELDPVFLLCDI